MVNRPTPPPVTPEQARESVDRFVASHFAKRDEEHARFTIPADPARDDDLLLSRFIDQYEAVAADNTRLWKALLRIRNHDTRSYRSKGHFCDYRSALQSAHDMAEAALNPAPAGGAKPSIVVPPEQHEWAQEQINEAVSLEGPKGPPLFPGATLAPGADESEGK